VCKNGVCQDMGYWENDHTCTPENGSTPTRECSSAYKCKDKECKVDTDTLCTLTGQQQPCKVGKCDSNGGCSPTQAGEGASCTYLGRNRMCQSTCDSAGVCKVLDQCPPRSGS
jgi:hypothetical protein